MKWWSALSSWMVKYQSRADHLFIYDGKRGQLDRCFDRNISLHSVDEATIGRLYQAAAEGRLGLLNPKDLKPLRLTTDPEKIFSSGKVTRAEQDRAPATPARKVPAEEGEKTAMVQKLDVRNLDHAAADPAVSERLREAETLYRNVVYAPRKAASPAPADVPGEENSPAKERTDRADALERAVEAVRNTMTLWLGDGFDREKELLIEDLAQMAVSLGETEEQRTERMERERKAREELIEAQNVFIWAAASHKRDQEELEKRMELLEQIDKLSAETALREQQWWRRMENVSRLLYDMDMAGASENDCGEKIRDYLDGKVRPKQEEEPEENREEDIRIPGELWGNTLRHFCRFAASEVPLSVRHIQVAEFCRKILEEKEGQGLSMDDLGLNQEEQMVVRGTIEMGVLIERGLLARESLISGRRLSPGQYRECLQNYLAMKGIEETLIPHVQGHQEEINAGDGPASALQILMANRGFRADDLRMKAGKTEVMTRLSRMDRQKVARMIRQNGSEIATMGQQVMLASCQMSDMAENKPEPVREAQQPQMGGPRR